MSEGTMTDYSNVRAVVFDMDGTIINSTVDFRKMKKGMIQELGAMGVPTSLLDPGQTIVVLISRVEAYFVSEGRGEELPRLRAWVNDLMNRTELERVEETTPVDGARDVLLLLRRRGYRLGLLTRGSRAYAVEALRVAGIDIGFDVMVCRDDYPEEEAKPNGLAMKRICQMMGTPVEECLLVGDHLIDLSCARSSASKFLGVLTGAFKEEDWGENECFDVIDSVRSLPSLLRIDKYEGR